MEVAIRVMLTRQLATFLADRMRDKYMYCLKTWWHRTPTHWDPLPHDRYLVDEFDRLAQEWAANQGSPEATQLARSLLGDHRLLPMARSLRVLLAGDRLPHPVSQPPTGVSFD